MSAIRFERLNSELMKGISEIIRDRVNDPRLSSMCSVTSVEITRDLKHAKVFVSVYDTDEFRKTSIEVLNNASGMIVHELNGMLRMRRMPQLHFIADTSIEYSVHISKVIAQINSARKDESDA